MQEVTGTAVPHERLKQYLAAESNDLLKTLRLYVWRAGLAEGTAVTNLARELLSEVVVEALNHADRFDPQRQPKAWLLGIAANLVRRKRITIIKQARREPLIQDISQQPMLSEDELFERLTTAHTPSPDGQYEMQETVTAVLRQLSTDDQHIITLAIMLEMDGDTLAKTLGVQPGAARMRLHRALNRLRESWVKVNRGNA
ncbi:MAG TPA: sigma-70 family RNA polymerase sigma factor [Chloroflexota bacterium]|nr:sigma-70 family RNA polymerase sigma factor [Chloroflexota bacterium]HUM70983.1 sigma-70 family RNA polymerase sigma factor [Chloroflexota bacterium]